MEIKKTENEVIKTTKIDEKEKNKHTTLKTSFINYFSLGLDARIGFGTFYLK